MQDNPSTENVTYDPLVERDLWEQAFEPFDGEHDAALRLGFNFAMLWRLPKRSPFVSQNDFLGKRRNF